MAFTKCNVPDNAIGSLGTTPQERGLTEQEFKDRFDYMPEAIKAYINGILTVELDNFKSQFDTHKADDVTDADGAHGLKVESGTFTPVLVGTTTVGSNTYANQYGKYTKIGDRVFIEIHLQLSAKDAAMAGGVRIVGLPFPVTSVMGYRSTFSLFYHYIDLRDSRTTLETLVASGWSHIAIRDTGNNIEALDLSVSQISTSTTLMLSGSYLVV